MAALTAFMGSWREVEKDGFDQLANAIGLSPEKFDFFKNAKIEITYKKDGADGYAIDVGFEGDPNKRTFPFKVGEPYDSASIDGSPLSSQVTVAGDRLVEKHTYTSGSNNTNMVGMVMDIERYIQDGKMIVITKVGGLEMKSIYEAI